MPTVYKKKKANRARWTEDQLKSAKEDVRSKLLSINEASKRYNIPATTLRRRLKAKDDKKPALGSPSYLGEEIESSIVAHIKRLQAHGFAPTRTEVCKMAYGLAKRCKMPSRFNDEKEKAGKGWFILFMNRHPELSIRKSEGVSLARANGMRRDDVSQYFQLLGKVLIENDVISKPGHIYNMDETGCQLNNRPEFVIAERGSKNVAGITSCEKGETVTVIVCCNAEGNFLPPACVFRGMICRLKKYVNCNVLFKEKNKKVEFEDGMPPGSVVYMGAYVNSELFYSWLKEIFVPRKPPGKVVLILDGHSSHCNNAEMLEYAVENDVILLCLPPHTTQFLQPLDRAFFKSLKCHFYAACNLYMRNNARRKITRLQFGHLLSSAWGKSANPSNGVSGFSATGIFPFNPDAIPDYAFIQVNQIEELNNQPALPAEEERNEDSSASTSEATFYREIQIADVEQGKKQRGPVEVESPPPPSEINPGKILNIISPIPSTSKALTLNRRKQKARILTSVLNVSEQKEKSSKRRKTYRKSQKPKSTRKQVRIAKDTDSSSDAEKADLQLDNRYDAAEDFSQDNCAGCGENYHTTTKLDDWMQCVFCKIWSHDSCTSFVHSCNKCGNQNLKKK